MCAVKQAGIFGLAFLLFWTGISFADIYFKDVTRGIKDAGLNAVAVDPQNQETVYLGSSKGIYKTTNGGINWINILSVRADVNFIAINPQNPLEVYAATNNGLYKTENGGKDWKKNFSGAGEGERNILCIAIDKSNNIYIGTQGGIFVSRDVGENWQDLGGRLNNLSVRFIAIHPFDTKTIYSATGQGVFKSKDSGNSWERIFITQKQEEVDVTALEDLDELETDELTQASGEVRAIYIDPLNPKDIYLASLNGVYITNDSGASWKAIEQAGLQGLSVKSITASVKDLSVLYAATDRGMFEYSSKLNKWRQLYNGLTSNDIRMLVFDNSGSHLWLATSNGIFKSEQSEAINENFKKGQDILSYFDNEPTIKEIQDAAIRYAEVHPDKIASWRKQAKLKAVLPDLSFSADTNLTDFRHWDSGTNPDTLLRGKKDIDYTATLSWDLGDFIWSTDQTSIDVRSRLMVQLRDDILDEVTRLYFERRRLQIELITAPPEDTKTYLEKELRLQELTADIDGLTGGYLSRQLSKLEPQDKR